MCSALTQAGEPLTWEIGGRVLVLRPLLLGLVELGVVIAAALALNRDVARTRLVNPS